LLQSVNLDQRGEKFIPGACTACHGGSGYSGQFGAGGSTSLNLDSEFLPFDLDNFQFSTVAGLRRPDQEAALRGLNRRLALTNPAPAITDLLAGWYPTPTSTHQGQFIPPAWTGHERLYSVIKSNCRSCHVALDPAIALDSFAGFQANKYVIAKRVCGAVEGSRYSNAMPNAKATFDRFWGNIGGPSGVNQPLEVLRALIQENTREDTDPDQLNALLTCRLP
jgi:hypothetical protein